jgi:hypothetical protein
MSQKLNAKPPSKAVADASTLIWINAFLGKTHVRSSERVQADLLNASQDYEQVGVRQGWKAKRRSPVMKRIIAQSAVTLGIVLALSACTDPYDPGQRALGGGLIGAGAGAAIGSLAGGGQGAVAGALIGGAVGAVGGAVTTPQPPPPGYYQRPGYYQQPSYYQGPGYYQPSSYYRGY